MKKFTKGLLFGAAIGAVAAGAYYFMKKNEADRFDEDDFDDFDEFDEDAFKTGEQSGILVSASCKRNRSSMMTQTGTTVTAFPATRVSVNGMITRNALSLSDDTPIDVVKQHMFGTKYQLSDGTELLWEHTSSGPDNVYVGGIESFDDLSEAAKDRVLSFYTDRGLLYSVQA